MKLREGIWQRPWLLVLAAIRRRPPAHRAPSPDGGTDEPGKPCHTVKTMGDGPGGLPALHRYPPRRGRDSLSPTPGCGD